MTSPKLNSPLISIVIPAYNEAQYLKATLQSLVHQTYPNFEILVVNNNSTDTTVKIAQKFNVKILLEKNKGIAWARQRGFLEAKGEIIATTDADTIVPIDWIEDIERKFSQNPKLVAFGGFHKLSSKSHIKIVSYDMLFRFVLFFDYLLSHGWNLYGSNMAVRRSAFEKVGGFNTKLLLQEEKELSTKLRKIGDVQLDQGFLVQTSDRRVKNGFIAGLLPYLKNELLWRTQKKQIKKFEDIR